MRLLFYPDPIQKKVFTDLVKKQWQENWNEIEKEYASEIVLGEEDGDIVVGMGIFRNQVPEKEEFQTLYKNRSAKSVYLGYLVVEDSQRKKGIGTIFLQQFLQDSPEKEFWLVIEDPRLQEFYEKNGFCLIKRIEQEKVLRLVKKRIFSKKNMLNFRTK